MSRALPPDPARLVGAGRLAERPSLDAALAVLAAFEPPDAAQERERDRILAFCREHTDALWRTCPAGHLTASALVLDAAGERCLLTHHAKLRRWLQLGGHCDGDGNLARVALREALEESGVEGLRIDPLPVDVDVHAIPARPGEPEHLHLDTRFLVWAPPDARPAATAESLEVAWLHLDELDRVDTDGSVVRLAERATSRSS